MEDGGLRPDALLNTVPAGLIKRRAPGGIGNAGHRRTIKGQVRLMLADRDLH
jgi:hypothetical protein